MADTGKSPYFSGSGKVESSRSHRKFRSPHTTDEDFVVTRGLFASLVNSLRTPFEGSDYRERFLAKECRWLRST